MEHTLYHYNALVTSVYDGDTCTVDIDLGLHSGIRDEKLRLPRINAPELRGRERPNGLKFRNFLRSKIEGKNILIQTIKYKKGKFTNINNLIVKEGFAVYKKY